MNKPLQIDLESLFKWKGELEITDHEGNVIETLYQRIVGDADIQRARVHALKESRLLRRKLNDPESDEAIINLPYQGEKERDELISMIIFSNYTKYRSQAEVYVQEEKIKEPKSDADLEEQEQYVEDVERAEKEYEEKLTSKIKEIGDKETKKLRELSDDELLDAYKEHLIDYLCGVRMMAEFDSMATYLGTYKDEEMTERRFESYEAFNDLAPQVKNQIIDGYRNLPMEMKSLKK